MSLSSLSAGDFSGAIGGEEHTELLNVRSTSEWVPQLPGAMKVLVTQCSASV